MSLKITFGQRVRALRSEKGISQEELAGRADIDRTYMSGIERGERNVSIEIAQKLALALEMTLSELFHFNQ